MCAKRKSKLKSWICSWGLHDLCPYRTLNVVAKLFPHNWPIIPWGKLWSMADPSPQSSTTSCESQVGRSFLQSLVWSASELKPQPVSGRTLENWATQSQPALKFKSPSDGHMPKVNKVDLHIWSVTSRGSTGSQWWWAAAAATVQLHLHRSTAKPSIVVLNRKHSHRDKASCVLQAPGCFNDTWQDHVWHENTSAHFLNKDSQTPSHLINMFVLLSWLH